MPRLGPGCRAGSSPRDQLRELAAEPPAINANEFFADPNALVGGELPADPVGDRPGHSACSTLALSSTWPVSTWPVSTYGAAARRHHQHGDHCGGGGWTASGLYPGRA